MCVETVDIRHAEYEHNAVPEGALLAPKGSFYYRETVHYLSMVGREICSWDTTVERLQRFPQALS